LIVLPVELLVVAVNYTVDPANILSSSAYVTGIADILSKGHNVDNVSNYDERLLQQQMIRKIAYKPDVVVLGSSRIMEVGSDFFPGKKVLNCGVSHANINDIVAIVGLLDSTGKLPASVVLNLDPFLICKGGTKEWETLAPYYRYFVGRLGANGEEAGSNAHQKLATLLSFEYFEKALAFLGQGKNKRYQDVGADKPSHYGRYADGAICYPAAYINPDTIKVAGDARTVGAREQADLDTSRLNLLNRLLDYLESKDVKVTFVMLPFHSQYFQMMNLSHPHIFSAYENIYSDLAKRRKIAIHGSYDAVRIGVPQGQFYDAHHCSPAAIKQTFSYQLL
jgi:hypothetical protein